MYKLLIISILLSGCISVPSHHGYGPIYVQQPYYQPYPYGVYGYRGYRHHDHRRW